MALRNSISFCCCILVLANVPAIAAEPSVDVAVAQTAMEPALAAIRLKNFLGAAQLLEPMAQRGIPEAQYLLACLYRAGLGVDVDPAKERDLLTAAATRNHASAAYSLSLSYLREEPRDPDASRRWLELAASLGQQMAERSLRRGGLPLQFLPATDLEDANARLSAFWFAAETDDVDLITLLANPESISAANEFGRDALMRASEAGAARGVHAMLQLGANPNRADNSGATALMLASAAGSAEAVTALLQAGAALEVQDSVGNTALMHAARMERVVVIRLLLEAMRPEANFNIRNVQGWTALDWALRSESIEAIQALRAAGITATVAKRDSSTPQIPLRRAGGTDLYAGWSDLSLSATRSSAEVLDSLLGPARPRPWTASEIRTAFANAVTTGNPDTAQRLIPLVRGLEGNAGSSQAVDPALLDWAIRHGDANMVRVLLPAMSKVAHSAAVQSPALAATQALQPEILRTLLDSGFGFASTDQQGRDALMLAARAKRVDLLEILLQHGAEPSRVDQQGRTAFWYAAQADFFAGARLLLRPANRDLADALGASPLAIAASSGHTAIVGLLLGNGANANGTGSNSLPPLLLAAANGHSTTVEQLLAAGATPDATGSFGNTALIVAAKNGHIVVVKQLLAAGAKRQLRNLDGNAAVDIADALRNAELAAVLEAG